MSLPDFLQNNLEFLINELDARATQQLMSNGHVEDRLLDILNGLESFLPAPTETPAPVVAVDLAPVAVDLAPVAVEAPEVEVVADPEPVVETPVATEAE